MKQRFISLLLAACLLLTLPPPARAAGGSGTEEDPYRIESPADWERLANSRAGEWFRLENPIDFAGSAPPTSTAVFRGHLLGNGFTVTQMALEVNESGTFGLFGEIAAGATVEGLAVEGTVTVNASDAYAGGLAGRCLGALRGCSFQGNLTIFSGSNSYLGGLVGQLTGAVRDSWYCGSVCEGTKRGSATSGGQRLGGIAGEMPASGAVRNCAASGVVKTYHNEAPTYVGGIAGACAGALENCWYQGELGGALFQCSGLAGSVSSALTAANCYWLAGSAAVTGPAVGEAAEALPVTALNGWAAGQTDGYYTWSEGADGAVLTPPAPPDPPPGREEGSGTVTCGGLLYGDSPAPAAVSATNGAEHVVFSYKRQGEEDGAYTRQPPVEPGAYTVRAFFPETDSHTSCAATADFTIGKAPLTVAARPVTIYAGEALPAFAADYRGFVYGEGPGDLSGALDFRCIGDGAVPGTFEIALSGLASRHYDIEFQSADLTVLEYPPAPQNAYAVDAPTGKEGWHRSPFAVRPGTGYTIAASAAGPFGSAGLTIGGETENSVKEFYLKDSEGRKFAGRVPYRLDATFPVLTWTGGTLALDPDQWYPAATVAVEASDALSGIEGVTLLIPQEVEGATCTISLPGSHSITARAEDRAGNCAALGPITVNVDPVITYFSDKVNNLTDMDTYSTVQGVAAWHQALTEEERVHIAASDDGVAALSRLEELKGSFQAPAISRHPQGEKLVYGSVAGTLSVEAAGKALSYQWSQDGNPLPGTAGASYSLPADLPAGTYRYTCAVRCGGDGPETVSGEAVVTVSPRPLTVRAEDKRIYVGDPLPAFSVQYEGLAPGESGGALNGTLTFQCEAGTAAGTYPIRPSGLTSPDYAIAFAPGVLTVSEPLSTPQGAFAPDAPTGRGGWYTAPFAIRPGAGYALSGTVEGPFRPEPLTIDGETGDGKAVFYLRDGAGGKYAASLAYRLDATAPDLSWSVGTAALDPAKWYPAAAVAVEASDSLSGLERVTLYIPQEMEGTEWTPEQAGSYTVTARAADRAGNEARLSAVTVNVDPIIASLSDKVNNLTQASLYSSVAAVWNWYEALPEDRRGHVAASDQGQSALARLAELKDSFQPPVLTAQPQGAELVYGAVAGTLSVEAAGKALSYQWRLNGEALPGASGNSYALPGGLHAGTYRYTCAVRCGGDGPETVSGEAVVSVSRRPMTVCAEDMRIYVGDPLPEYAVTYEGFAAGDGPSALSGTLAYQCGADPAAAGEYPILPSGLESADYSITFQPGTLTVSSLPAPPEGAALVDAPTGRDGWYIAPFRLRPGPGYTLSSSAGGPFRPDPITVSGQTAESVKEFYLRDSADARYLFPLHYRLDAGPPVLTWSPETAVLDAAKWYSSARIAAEGTDNLSGLEHIKLYIPQEMEVGSVLLTVGGSYSIAARGWDRAGNESLLGPITVHVDPVIGVLSDRMAVLADNDFDAAGTLHRWYDGLTPEEKGHIASSDEGVAALNELEALEQRQSRARDFIAAVSAVERPLERADRRLVELLTGQYTQLGDARACVDEDTLRRFREMETLLKQAQAAEAALWALPEHLPGPDCPSDGERGVHAAAAESAMLAYAALDGEGRALCLNSGAEAERQYQALMKALGHWNRMEGVTVYGLADHVDTSSLAEGATTEQIRVFLKVEQSLPAGGLEELEAALRAESPGLVRLASLDISLLGGLWKDGYQVYQEPVQPKEGEQITVKFALESNVKPDSLRIYHVHGGLTERLTREGHGLRVVETAEAHSVLFEAASFSHFLFYAEKEAERPLPPTPPAPTPGGGGGSPGKTEPQKEEPPTPVFTDLAGHWAGASCLRATSLGLMDGLAENAFRPDADLTRREAAQLLWRMAGRPSPQGAVPFWDLPADAAWAAWGAEQGLMQGTGDGAFAPGRTVTRQELAVFFHRYAQWSGADGDGARTSLQTFSDSGEIAPWAMEAAGFCGGLGIITGRPGGYFAPWAQVTRGEAAAMLSRFLDAFPL